MCAGRLARRERRKERLRGEQVERARFPDRAAQPARDRPEPHMPIARIADTALARG